MALVTLILLLLFCAPPVRAGMANPPQWLVKVSDELTARIDPVAMWVLVYALVSIFLTPFFVSGTLDVLVRLFASIMLLLLALGEGAPQLMRTINDRTGEQTNEAIAESLNDIIAGVVRHQKLLSYIGLAAAVLLFAVLFR